LPDVSSVDVLGHAVEYLLAKVGPPVSVSEQLTSDAEFMVG
jgi:hypothetical protein